MLPVGGLGLPPNTDVMRRMKVDLPQPTERFTGYCQTDTFKFC